jgi:hypothetical protein
VPALPRADYLKACRGLFAAARRTYVKYFYVNIDSNFRDARSLSALAAPDRDLFGTTPGRLMISQNFDAQYET